MSTAAERRTHPTPERAFADRSLEEYAEDIWDGLCTNVDRSVADADRAKILMSGGIDSTLLGAVLVDLGLTSVEAVTCGYADPALYGDETAVVRRATELLGLGVRETVTGLEWDLGAELRRVVRTLEQPTRFAIALPVSRMLKVLQGEADQLLTGLFADRLFGQDDHDAARWRRRYGAVPNALRGVATIVAKTGTKLPGVQRAARDFLAARFDSSLEHYMNRFMFNRDLVGLLPTGDLMSTQFFADVTAAIDSYGEMDAEVEMSLVGILTLADNWTALFNRQADAAGVEVILPFGGLSQFQRAMGMPGVMKHAKGVEKPALRLLSERHFGDEFTRRPKKMFAAPLQHWLLHSRCSWI